MTRSSLPVPARSLRCGTQRPARVYGKLTRHDDDHEISSLTYLHDGSGFVSAGMDRKIIVWDNDGGFREEWPLAPIRICDHALSPDGTYLVAVGTIRESEAAVSNMSTATLPLGNGLGGLSTTGTPGSGTPGSNNPHRPRRKIVIYDLKTRSEK